MSPIAHALSVRSGFSTGEAILTPKKAVKLAKQLGYESVALVDTMNVSGMPDLFSAAKGEGIKPILGVTLKVFDSSTWKKADGGDPPRMHTLKAYPRNEVGMQQLYRLLSLAFDATHFYYEARVTLDEVIEHLQPGDVAISTGDFFGLVTHPDYLARGAQLATHFGELWVEVVPINTPLYDTLNHRAHNLAARVNCFGTQKAKPLLIYPALYPEGEADALDVMRVIAKNDKVTDGWVWKPYTRDLQLGKPEDLVERLRPVIARGDVSADFLKDAVRNIAVFAGMPFYTFEKKPPCLPQMAPDEFKALVGKCVDGWKKRFDTPTLGHQPTKEELAEQYKPRLAFELEVIQRMGFSGYFLLVQDIVLWSKGAGVMVGPGRGSVGGSLIAYLMEITDVDPIRFNLLFERFINPGRVDLPDADLDFMSTRRHEVIEYIERTYGAENVASISNYVTLGAASAIRDVSRVHSLDPFEYDCSKQCEAEHGESLSLEENAERVADIAKYRDKYAHLWKHCLSLEGVNRSLGKHAAGVVVAGEPVIRRAVVESRSGTMVVNWDKRTVEDHGLIKMDILGLSTLDTLALGKDYVKRRWFKDIDYMQLALDDKKVLEAFARGETVGVFQYESAGMRKLLTELGAGGELSFEDLVAVTALFRPGPLDAGMCDEYVGIKQGARAPYIEHPNLESALSPTYGVLIYQEQVMQICRDYAGFTMTESDNVRKAMGKKDKDKMAEYKEKFIQGAVTVSGVGEYQADSLWEKIAGFAAYGFNRSHAVEYAVISWWSMWLKVSYPAEFFAAAMSVVDKDEKLATLMMDARRLGINVLPPDINLSANQIEIRDDTTLLAPFQAVKGISEASAKAILTLRALAGGQFANLAHLVQVVTDNKMGAKCNVNHRKSLERVGAFYATDGGLQPLHPDRLKDRLELMPGFTIDAVKADRKIPKDTFILAALTRLQTDIQGCQGCSLKGQKHVMPRMGRSPKFMVVFDTPGWPEEKAGQMLEGDTANYLKAALKDAGLSANDGYYTALVKAPKIKGAKTLSTEQINGCTQFLEQELEVLKPPVILAMGAASIKYFAPSVKGNTSELLGKVAYDSKRDASIVFGFNPAQVIYDPSKVALLQEVATRTADLVQ